MLALLPEEGNPAVILTKPKNTEGFYESQSDD
jgi:hypothetical protein